MQGGKTDVVELDAAGRILCVHHIPGRLRLKGRGLRGNPVALGALRRALLAIDGVTDALPSQFTGSIVVYYDHANRSPDVLRAQLALLGIRIGTPAPTSTDQEPFGRIFDAIASKLCAYAIEALARAAIEAI